MSATPEPGGVPDEPGLWWRKSFHDLKWKRVAVSRGHTGLVYRQRGVFWSIGPDPGTPAAYWGGPV